MMIHWVCVAALMAGCGHAQVRIRTVELARAVKGVSYRAPIETLVDGRCEHSDPSYSLVSGALPKGLELVSSGLDGTPKEMGLFRFVLRAGNPCGADVRALELLVTARPILRADPEQLAFESRADGPAPGIRTIRVTSTWPDLPYSVRTDGADWLVAWPARGATPDTGSAISADLVTIRVDPSKLAPGVYRASLILSTWQGANTPEIPVVLTVRKD
jgi:hypothetical protein